MSVIEQNSLPFKPYARLMNILGDQLITDKIIAVIEILKNSYDADSESAEVCFWNMDKVGFNDLPKDSQACIEIRDKGCGMTLDIIKNVWLRPATPEKYDKKLQKKAVTPRGRIIQGEKGIGRFAIHKLGEKIEVYTKAKGNDEVKLEMNFSDFDPENSNIFNQGNNHKLLEEVSNTWYVNRPPEEVIYESGTIIKIYNLREQWSNKDFENLYKNIQRLIPPVDKNAAFLGVEFKRDFNVNMYIDDKLFASEEVMTFEDVIDRAQYTMIGSVDDHGIMKFKYKSNIPYRVLDDSVNLLDKEALTAKGYNLQGVRRFVDGGGKYSPKCGSFNYTFYAFDLKTPDRTILNSELKNFIKENFVYVLRDGVRVYPYGEKGIDWLNLDKLRSTYKAGQFISYNDLTGFIYISQEDNPLLKDASNRQGIVNTQGAYDDFTALVTAVTEVFNAEIKIDKFKSEIQREKIRSKTKHVLATVYDDLKDSLLRINDSKTLNLANKFVDAYSKYLDVVDDRMKTVEDLAGLGMAVEKSSHETLRLLLLMRKNIKEAMVRLQNHRYTEEDILQILSELDENIALVYDDMQMIQPLFKIQRKAIKNVSILDSVKKVIKYYRFEIDNKIETNVDKIQSDFFVTTNVGLILQVIINLVDNAIFWLNESGKRDKKLYFAINAVEKTMIIADNGDGIREDIIPIIFNEFVSMKSNGRGLGLYIVRELLIRINSEIYVIEKDSDKILPGANFIVKFNQEDTI